MRKDLDKDTVMNVIDRMNTVLRETVGTKPPIDIEQVERLRFPNSPDIIPACVMGMQAQAEKKAFSLALSVAERELKGNLPNDYYVLGARYLLMPSDYFATDAERYNFNLFRLIKQIYTNVTIDDIAYHLVDECDCAVKSSRNGKMCLPVGWTRINDSGLYKLERDVVMNTLADPKRTYTLEISEYRKITGWVAADNRVMLVYFNEEYR